MYKVPAKYKRAISQELKRFVPLIHNLQARGKSSSEDDARILLNDVLSYVLGYDKYNELKTELREKNNRYDYVVKLSEGPNARKKDRYDFVIEAKAAHITLSDNHVNQTLSYCLTHGMDFFILTNAACWRLYHVKHSKKNPTAILIHEVDFGKNNSVDSLAEEFYLFSKASYLAGDWKYVVSVSKATKIEDITAILLSDKIIKSVAKQLEIVNGVKVHSDIIKEVIENQIIKSSVDSVNKKLLKKINEKKNKTFKHKNPQEEATDSNTQNGVNENVISAEIINHSDSDDNAA